MRPLNAASYIMIEGFEGLAPDGLPGHRRVDHRLRATSEGSGRRNPHRGPSLQGTRTPSGRHIRQLHPNSPKFRKINNI